ncbi:MAG: hypothetical protein ABIM99_06250 [Candidatus Dojkabacteria bacterium]
MQKVKKFFTKNLEDVVSLDLRALGIFRVFLGGIFLIDFLDRLKDVSIFYASGGVGVVENVGLFNGTSFSLNFLNGDYRYQAFILIVGATLSFLLLVGFKTRITTILLWIIVISVQNRNFLILQGGDDYMRILLFWAMFLPVGVRFSYDYLKNKTEYKKLDNKSLSPVNIGLIFQIIFLYYFSALSKSDPIWNKNFTAIYYSLSLDIFVTWLGRILLTLKPLLVPLTAFVYYLEKYVGLLLIQPFGNWITRTIGIILIIGLHLGIGTTIDVGQFPWIAICGVMALMPTEAIDFAISKLEKNKYVNRVDLSKYIRKLEQYIPEKNPQNTIKLKKHIREILFLTGTIVISLFTLSVTFVSYIWNMNNNKANIELIEELRQPFVFVRMDQLWAMFAPYPFTDDGWYVIQGNRFDGKAISLFGSNTKTNYEKFPDNYSQDFNNERWRKFMTNLYYETYSSYRKQLLRYMCNEYNSDDSNSEKLESIEMHYMLQRTLPDFQTGDLQNLDFGRVTCST